MSSKADKRPLERLPAAEDRFVTADATNDPDNPILTDEEWAETKPAEVLVPEIVAAFRMRRRGERGQQKSPTKQKVTLRLDQDLLTRLRSTGPGWQTRLNDSLRRWVGVE